MSEFLGSGSRFMTPISPSLTVTKLRGLIIKCQVKHVQDRPIDFELILIDIHTQQQRLMRGKLKKRCELK